MFKMPNFAGTLSIVPMNKKLELSLDVLKCEIFTVSPVRVNIVLLNIYLSTFCTNSSKITNMVAT